MLRCEYFNLHFFFLCIFAAPVLDVRLFRSEKSTPISWKYVMCGRATALVCALEDDAKHLRAEKVIFEFHDGQTELHYSQTEDPIHKRRGQTATTTTAAAKHNDSLKTHKDTHEMLTYMLSAPSGESLSPTVSFTPSSTSSSSASWLRRATRASRCASRPP